jgi:hypothetical protein
MAPSLEVESILDVPRFLDEKNSGIVEVADTPETVKSGSSASTVQLPFRETAKFEIEDHPVDVKPHIKFNL